MVRFPPLFRRVSAVRPLLGPRFGPRPGPLPRRLRLALALIALWALCAAQAAQAGAWPRAEGTVFLSWQTAIKGAAAPGPPRPFDRYEQIYLEYGLGDGLTLTADAYREDMEDRPWSGMISVSSLLKRFEDGSVLAVEGGFGFDGSQNGEKALRLRSGLQYGRGFSAPFPGWLSLGAHYEMQPLAGEVDDESAALAGDTLAALLRLSRAPQTGKVAATLGMHPARDVMAMLQLRAEATEGEDPVLTLAPSAAWRLSPHLTLQLSGERGLSAPHETEASLKIWMEF